MSDKFENSLPKGLWLHSETNDYKIVDVLGRGSFGITYIAAMSRRGSDDAPVYVAVKEFFMHEVNGREGSSVSSGSSNGLFDKYRQKFIKEAQNLTKLHNPNIIRVIELFQANNTVYYSMEFVDGGSIDDCISTYGPLSQQETLRMMNLVVSALGFMHSNRILHLDLKPSNIMLTTNGNPVLIDFGLSKQFDENGLPESSTTVGGGTPGYSPMEQSTYHGHKADETLPATMDIYAVGATMFKMLTGNRPPEASTIFNTGFPADELKAHGVDPRLIDVIRKAMAPAVRDRYQTMAQLAAALNQVSAALGAPVAQPATARKGGINLDKPTAAAAAQATAAAAVPPVVPPVTTPANHAGNAPAPEPRTQPAPRKKSLVWLWILLGVLGAAGIGTGVYLMTSSSSNRYLDDDDEEEYVTPYEEEEEVEVVAEAFDPIDYGYTPEDAIEKYLVALATSDGPKMYPLLTLDSSGEQWLQWDMSSSQEPDSFYFAHCGRHMNYESRCVYNYSDSHKMYSITAQYQDNNEYLYNDRYVDMYRGSDGVWRFLASDMLYGDGEAE